MLKNVGKIWRYGHSLLEFVEISDQDILDIDAGLKPEAIKKRFQKAKKLGGRDYWDFLADWNAKKYDLPKKERESFEWANIKTAQKYLKAFISSTYKSLGANPYNLLTVIEKTQRDLEKFEGVNLHQFALAKVADTFTKYSDYLLDVKLNPTDDYSQLVNEILFQMRQELININNPDYYKKIDRALEVMSA